MTNTAMIYQTPMRAVKPKTKYKAYHKSAGERSYTVICDPTELYRRGAMFPSQAFRLQLLEYDGSGAGWPQNMLVEDWCGQVWRVTLNRLEAVK